MAVDTAHGRWPKVVVGLDLRDFDRLKTEGDGLRIQRFAGVGIGSYNLRLVD